MRRILPTLLYLTLLLTLLPLPEAWAAERVIQLRIEGIESCLYSQTFVDRSEDGRLLSALAALTADNATLTIQGLDGGAITAVNGETATHSGGGWRILINGKPATLDAPLSDGDSIVLCYGAADILQPQADESRMADGLLRFRSNGEAAGGLTVTLTNGKNTHSFITDGDGYADLSDLPGGEYHMQIAKTDAAGLPLALRLPPNTKLRVEGEAFLQSTNIFALVVCIILGLGVAILFLVFSEKKRRR